MFSMDPLLPSAFVAFAILLLFSWHRRPGSYGAIIAKIPGPPSQSWVYGVLPDLLGCLVGELDFKWVALYGSVVRVAGPIGQTYLLISDPKAIQHIFQTSGYKYAKHKERRDVVALISGKGLGWAEGDTHKRQRKVVQPGFGMVESRALLPIFMSLAAKMSSKWNDLLSNSPELSIKIDITSWISGATLDAIGQAAFDYQFGTLDNSENEVSKSYQNLLIDTISRPTRGSILFLALMKYMPQKLTEYLLKSSRKMKRAREHQNLMQGFAKRLMDQKYEAALQGKGSRDVLSLIVNANVSENPKTRLSDAEVLSQMQTIMLAGHETTANTISWTLFELTRYPHLQDKLRAEIEEKILEKGSDMLTEHDYESMPYLTAIMKETLRFHPNAYHLFREAEEDDVLPLTTPVTLMDGTVIKELPIAQGQKIITSVSAYNRIEEIFGAEPHTFRPERWFEGRKSANVGVYANLMTFSGGVRNCIGWRFAILEIQTFLVELIRNFEFTLAVDHSLVRREASMAMAPTIAGEVEKGCQLPFIITSLARND